MLKTLKKEKVRRHYNQVIASRFQKQKEMTPRLKTQQTLFVHNQKPSSLYEEYFQQFSQKYKVKYDPILSPTNRKPIKRTLIPELIQLQKYRKNKCGQSCCRSQINVKYSVSQVKSSQSKRKKMKRLSGENTLQKKPKNEEKSKEKVLTIKRQKSQVQIPNLLLRCESSQLNCKIKGEPKRKKEIKRKMTKKK